METSLIPAQGKRKPSKGSATRDAILREGVALAREIGVSALSIGTLAERVGMSKSGLFAHFGAKEELQIAVLKAAQDDFTDTVLKPAFLAPRGLARLRAVVTRWLAWSGGDEKIGGCVILAASHEFDDRPGVVRDYLLLVETNLLHMLRRTAGHAIEAGELPPATDLDQFAFELFGMVMSSHFHTRLLRDPAAGSRAQAALERLIANPLLVPLPASTLG